MAVATHAEDEEGLDVDYGRCAENVLRFDDGGDGIAEVVEDGGGDVARRGGDTADGVEQHGGRGGRGEELVAGQDGEEGRDVVEVAVHEAFDDVALDTEVDWPGEGGGGVLGVGVSDLDEAVARLADLPGVVVAEVVVLVHARGDGRGGVEEECGAGGAWATSWGGA